MFKVFLGVMMVFNTACLSENESKLNPSGNHFLKPCGLLIKPPPLDGSRFQTFVSNLAFLANQSRTASNVSGAPLEPGASFYSKALSSTGPVPRSQGYKALTLILDEHSKACSQASCSAKLNMTKKDIDSYFDKLLFSAASLKESPERQILISSLTPDKAFREPLKDENLVYAIFHKPPKAFPQNIKKPGGILNKSEFEKMADKNVISAIAAFTSTGYLAARNVECAVSPDDLAQNKNQKVYVSSEAFALWKERCRRINEAFYNLPYVKVPVYRGITLPLEDLARWMKKWHQKEPIFLGPKENPALTSASWDPDVATQFLINGQLSRSKGLAVLIEIIDHRGVGIEAISRMPGEREVLIPSWNQFMIEEIAPLEYSKPVFYIRIRGIPMKQGQVGSQVLKAS